MKCDFGDAVEKLSGKIDSLAKRDLHKLMKDALVTVAAYLVNELPIKVQVVFDAKFLHSKKQQARSAPGAISRLTRSTVSSLPEDTIKKEFKVTSSHVDVVVEVVSSQFRKYQMEIIPKSFYLLSQTSEASKERKQSSYWKYAYEQLKSNMLVKDERKKAAMIALTIIGKRYCIRQLEIDFCCLSLT